MDTLVEHTLASCHEAARSIERATDTLGRDWPGWAPLMDSCGKFRRRCDELVTGRGLDMETIAFVGPKKAGKSTLLRDLIRDESARRKIKCGPSLRESTEKLVWVGPKQPVGMDPAVEEYVPCAETAMPALGISGTLVDVPGENERDSARAHAAGRALDLALVKVLVVCFTDRHNAAVQELTRRAGRSLLLPVITQLRPTDDRAPLASYRAELAALAPEATVLEPLLSEHFQHTGTASDYETQFAHELTARLADALAGRPPAPLISELLEGDRRRFLTEARQIAALHLRASAEAAVHLRAAVANALRKAAAELLGGDRELLAGIRWSLRMTLLERTPGWCFPWRPMLSAASLSAGALDRLPIALVGSLPSLGAVIFQSVRNVRDGAAFQQSASDGLRSHLSQQLRDVLREQFVLLDDALRHDFGHAGAEAATGERASLEPLGLDELQHGSTQLIRDCIDRHTPGRGAALAAAALGFVMFWSLFGWPLASLYEELADGARAVWERRANASTVFPHGAGSMLFTAAFLALVPVFLFLLGLLSWFLRRSRVSACLAEVRSGHRQLCASLIETGVVSVRVNEPRLDSCLALLHREHPQGAERPRKT